MRLARYECSRCRAYVVGTYSEACAWFLKHPHRRASLLRMTPRGSKVVMSPGPELLARRMPC